MASLPDNRRKTSLKLSQDQLEKLQALSDALPREQSRLVGEMIDDIWATLPARIAAMARECAQRLVEQKWRDLSGRENLQNKNFRKLEPGYLSGLLTFTRHDVEEAFNGKAWRDWKVSPAPSPRQENPKVYFPRILSVAELGDVALSLSDPSKAAVQIKRTLIDLTFRILEMTKAGELRELKRKPASVTRAEREILDKAKDLQPDQRNSVLAFKRLQSAGKIPPEILPPSEKTTAKVKSIKAKRGKK
jgi:hypothetical protein